MIPVLSRQQMRAFDEHAIADCAVPSLVLMENAGRGAADVIEREVFGGRAFARRVVVVCGTGNNGGDGFVVARHLRSRGAIVEACLVGDPSRRTSDCRSNHEAFVGIGGKVTITAEPAELREIFGHAELLVDGLFGTGLDRAIEGPLAAVVAAMSGASAPIAALDVPSGLDADTGAAAGAVVEADLTIAFAHLKLAHVTASGARAAGRVHVVDIGVPPSLRRARSAELVEASDVRALLAPREVDAHKYRAGHVAVLAGSPGKTGAALLSAAGALRAGAGAVTIATWPEAAAALEAQALEVMVTRLDRAALGASLDVALRNKRAVVIGPGFGTGDAAKQALEHVVTTFGGVIVADADALTCFGGSPGSFAPAGGRLVLTPHAGELGRLLGVSSEAVEASRFSAARDAAKKSGAVVLLKGAYTVVASPSGELLVSGAGSPALATAGSGDVLAGIVGALACALPAFESAWAGAFVHGIAGSAWQKEHGDRGMLAREIAEGVPGVLGSLLG